MPNYDYYCESNGRTVEVSHRMAEALGSCGELCERAGIEPGRTPPCETTGVCCGGGCSTAH